MSHIPIGEVEPFIFGPYFLVPFDLAWALGVILLDPSANARDVTRIRAPMTRS